MPRQYGTEAGRFPIGKLVACSRISFVDKDPTTLCKQIKRTLPDAGQFMGHLKDDNGQTNFSATAFLGTRGLDEDQKQL